MKINKFGNYKENTIKFFNKMSYKNHGDSYKHYRNVFSWVSNLEFRNILDLGTGKGTLIGLLKENFKKGNFIAYGVDISHGMIEKANSSGIEGVFSIGDSAKLNFESGYFDLITCINSFHHYENPFKSTYEISRVLKTGGILILGEIFLPFKLNRIVNVFLPYGTTGDYKIYSTSELELMFKNENLHLVMEKYVFPSIKTYMFKKI